MKMNENKGKEKNKEFSCMEQIIDAYFPSDVKMKQNPIKENPKLLGGHFAALVLKQIMLS